MTERVFKNTVLRHLKPDSIKRLQLRALTLGKEYVIENGIVRSTAGPRPILHHREVPRR